MERCTVHRPDMFVSRDAAQEAASSQAVRYGQLVYPGCNAYIRADFDSDISHAIRATWDVSGSPMTRQGYRPLPDPGVVEVGARYSAAGRCPEHSLNDLAAQLDDAAKTVESRRAALVASLNARFLS